MRRRLVEKGTPPERITVIPNWVDTGSIQPAPRDNEWSREQGLVDRFVVMHSGNVGHAQNLDALVRATTFLRDLDDLTVMIIGGGARHASDKVLQFNGAGKLVVTKFQVENFGKLVRSCGNCKTQYKRTVVINDVDVTAPGKAIVGVNSNYGDTASLRKVRIHGDTKKKIKTCVRYKGNNTGKEPTELGTGADGTSCLFSSSDISYE